MSLRVPILHSLLRNFLNGHIWEQVRPSPLGVIEGFNFHLALRLIVTWPVKTAIVQMPHLAFSYSIPNIRAAYKVFSATRQIVCLHPVIT
jgi:hypothetical protein